MIKWKYKFKKDIDSLNNKINEIITTNKKLHNNLIKSNNSFKNNNINNKINYLIIIKLII